VGGDTFDWVLVVSFLSVTPFSISSQQDTINPMKWNGEIMNKEETDRVVIHMNEMNVAVSFL
jgi:hypothetical protein